MKNLKLRYQLQEKIREDIVSEFYHGRDTQTNEPVFICKFKKKYLSQPLIKQLMKYSEQLIDKPHEHILQLVDYAFDGVEFFVIYEGLSSFTTMEDYVQQVKWNSATLWKYMTQVLGGLVYLEQEGLAHGNLSLNTIIVTKEGEVKLVKPVLQALIIKRNIQKMDIIDDCLCLAPELINREAIRSQTDMYSFGVILHFLFSKSWPYPYTVSLDEYKKALVKGPKAYSKYESKIPDKLSEVIKKCLQLDASDRFNSFIDLIKTYKGEYSIDFTESTSTKVLSTIKGDLDEKRSKQLFRRSIYIIGALTFVIMLGLSYYLYSVYSTAIPERIVPSVVGLDKQQALEVLQQHRLKGVVAGERIHPLYEENMVIETKPRAGREVKQNRMIRLYLSKGQGAELVPDLIGRSKGQAEGLLFDRGLDADVIEERFSIEYAEGVIIDQIPTPNSLILPSENIQVVLSRGFPVSIDISKIKSTFFKKKEHLRQVTVRFSILPEWEQQKVTILFKVNGNQERIYSDIHQPEEDVTLEFELDLDGEVSVYFDDVNAYSQRIIDELE